MRQIFKEQAGLQDGIMAATAPGSLTAFPLSMKVRSGGTALGRRRQGHAWSSCRQIAPNSMSRNNFDEAGEQPFISHLIELRNRLLRAVLCVLVVFLGLASYANEIYSLLAGPLLQHMPKNSTMIAIDVASPFFTPFKLVLVVSAFISVPVILYQFWAFVAPGLYKRERRMIFPLLIASTLLFYMGVAFAYFVVFPLVFGFLTAAAPDGVAVMTDIAKYLDFVLALFFAFGVCFEVPIFTVVLVWTGLVNPRRPRR